MVKVAFARTQPEAEMLQGLLSEADIPSLLPREGGFLRRFREGFRER